VNPNHLQILSRFFDGETVDPALLAESLAQPEAATYLAECAALRAWTREDESRPSERFYEAMYRALKPGGARRPLWRWLVRPALAASMLLVGVALGYEYRSRVEPRPATPRVAVETRPAAMSPVVGELAVSGTIARQTPPGPALPTKAAAPPRARSLPVPVAQLRFGSWRETGRGGEEH